MRLKLLAEAEQEIDAAASWYEERRVGLGDDLLVEEHRAFNSILTLPLAWPVWPKAPNLSPPIRRKLLRRFEYAVAYQMYPEQIVVLALAHHKRQPFYWIDRVR